MGPAPAPGMGGRGTGYGRGGSVPASYGGPVNGAVPNVGNLNGFPPFQPPVGRFDIGRGGGGDRRGRGGGGEGRGRGFDSGRGGGGGRFGGNRSFDGGFGGGRGGGRGFDGRGAGGGRGDRHGPPSRGDLDNVALPRQDFGNLVPFEKNFYVESPSVRAMSEHEVVQYRARREITVEGQDVPKPIRRFEEANFPGTSFLTLGESYLSTAIAVYQLLCGGFWDIDVLSFYVQTFLLLFGFFFFCSKL